MAERTAAHWGLFTVVALTWLALAVALCIGVPRFEVMFTDFGVALPGLTRRFMNLSRWLLGNHPGQSVPGIVPALTSTLLVFIAIGTLTAYPYTRRAARIASAILLVLGGVTLLALIAAMMIPTVNMQMSMSGL